MHHVFLGRSIGRTLGTTIEINGSVTKFGPGVLWDSRIAQVVDAIRAGEIDGEIYSDTEVWVDQDSFEHWQSSATHDAVTESE